MPSKRLHALDAAIQRTASPVEAGCLRAERAALLARFGQVDLARDEIRAMQESFGRRPNAAVSAWLALAEGLADYYDDLDTDARQKVQRADALATAARQPALQALTAAWLAHMEFASSDLEPMVVHLSRALELAAPDQHAASARAALTAANAWHYAGRADRAQPWYLAARRHANADGDEATLAAILYNQAAWWVCESRFAALFDARPAQPETGGGARNVLAGAQSVAHYDQWVGSAPLTDLVGLLQAQVHALRGEHAPALALFDRHLAPAIAKGDVSREGAFRAEIAWCALCLGRSDDALAGARSAEAALVAHHDLDDRAAAHARLAEVYTRLGLADVGESHRREAARHWAEFEALRAGLAARLEECLPPPPSQGASA